MFRNSKIFGDLSWTSLASITISILGIVKISILARILDVNDFGSLAIGLFIFGLIEILSDLGLSAIVMHKVDLTLSEFSSLFILNIFIAVILFFGIQFGSISVSFLYNENVLAELIKSLSYVVLFSALGRLFKALHHKGERFKLLALIEVISNVIGTLIAIICALKELGLASYIYGLLAQHLVQNVLFFYTGLKYQGIIFSLNLKELSNDLKIGRFQSGSLIINYFNRDLDVLLVGKFFGTTVLGNYSLAKQLAYKPYQFLVPIVSKVSLPRLAGVQNNLKLLTLNYKKLLSSFSLVIITIYAFLFLFAEGAVCILYGNGYIIANELRFFCGIMMIRSILSPVGSLLVALGKTKLDFYWSIYSTLWIPVIVYFCYSFEIEVFMTAIMLSLILNIYPFWYMLIKPSLGIPFLEFLSYHFSFSSFRDMKRKND